MITGWPRLRLRIVISHTFSTTVRKDDGITFSCEECVEKTPVLGLINHENFGHDTSQNKNDKAAAGYDP